MLVMIRKKVEEEEEEEEKSPGKPLTPLIVHPHTVVRVRPVALRLIKWCTHKGDTTITGTNPPPLWVLSSWKGQKTC